MPVIHVAVSYTHLVEGYFKPEEWTDKDGVQHNRIVTVSVKFYPAVEKEEEVPSKPAKEAKKGKK